MLANRAKLSDHRRRAPDRGGKSSGASGIPKDDYAKYAVEPLLDGDGPLGDSSAFKTHLRVGVINRREYEDAELLMALREELNHDGNEYAFTDDEILGPLVNCTAWRRYHRRHSLNSRLQFVCNANSRYQQAVRSTMVLSLTELISKISKKPSCKQRPLTALYLLRPIKSTIILQTL